MKTLSEQDYKKLLFREFYIINRYSDYCVFWYETDTVRESKKNYKVDKIKFDYPFDNTDDYYQNRYSQFNEFRLKEIGEVKLNPEDKAILAVCNLVFDLEDKDINYSDDYNDFKVYCDISFSGHVNWIEIRFYMREYPYTTLVNFEYHLPGNTYGRDNILDRIRNFKKVLVEALEDETLNLSDAEVHEETTVERTYSY